VVPRRGPAFASDFDVSETDSLNPAVTASVSPLTIFLVYLRLGCTSFGGPIAHLGYFREEFVVRRKWLDDATFTDIVGLCQFLPGPASSQVGFTIGLLKGGGLGAFAAWTAFTLPSALLMFFAAWGHGLLSSRTGTGVVHTLELVAVAVIAQAVWGMMQTLAPDRTRASIAVVVVAMILLSGRPVSQLVAIALGGMLGLIFCRGIAAQSSHALGVPISRPVAVAALVTFFVLLVGPSVFLTMRSSHAVAFFEAFYRSGALVFGGGHVVLPLLQSATVSTGWIDNNTFLAGYGAAQALSGPLFTFAALSWSCSPTVAARRARDGNRTCRHFSSRPTAPGGRTSVLGSITSESDEPHAVCRSERERRGSSSGCFVSAGLDERRAPACGFRIRACVFLGTGCLESAAVDGGHCGCCAGRGVEFPGLRFNIPSGFTINLDPG
jgi:putative chromate ion transporter